MSKHVVFYDGECPLCNRAVRFLLKHDSNACLLFAPLQGETAKKLLGDRPDLLDELDTMVVIENYGEGSQNLLIRGKAALRLAWFLGGTWAFFGLFSFLPAFPFDWAYRLIAKNRYRLFNGLKDIPKDLEGRFLP
ncbi:Uncharacterized protein YuxK [Chlamydiales bacterium SCGC AG-110-M15]|nr:Uncharacterized protein YuxK [Chlamydiales bacterium SCGC AG-110-M15]